MALLTKNGYGQVEPNHLSAQRTAQIYAQLPCDDAVEILENGSFLKYDYAAGKCSASTAASTAATTGEFMLVFNEIKLYDNARQGYKDFALKKSEMVDGVITPRLFKVNDGDIFTTNLVDVTTAKGSRVGKLLVPTVSENVAILTEKVSPANGDEVYVIVKETTMPDGQEAVKVQKLYTKHDVNAGG